MTRIYLTGASGTGKTSVGKILAERLDLPHLPSVSRGSPFQHGTREHQNYVTEQLAEVANEPGVHDRTLIDVMAYNAAYGYRDLNQKGLDYFAGWSFTNPIVIYFPILFDAVDDGVRPTDREFNIKVDENIQAGLTIFNCSFIFTKTGQDLYYTVGDSTPEERADKIMEYIKERT